MLDLSWKFSPFMAVVCVAATSYHDRVEFPLLFVAHHLYHINRSFGGSLAEFAARKPRIRSEAFFAAECMWRKIPLAERTVRRRKLRIVRFGPRGQSSFAPLLLLLKWKQCFHFKKDVSSESAGIRACADARHSGE